MLPQKRGLPKRSDTKADSLCSLILEVVLLFSSEFSGGFDGGPKFGCGLRIGPGLP